MYNAFSLKSTQDSNWLVQAPASIWDLSSFQDEIELVNGFYFVTDQRLYNWKYLSCNKTCKMVVVWGISFTSWSSERLDGHCDSRECWHTMIILVQFCVEEYKYLKAGEDARSVVVATYIYRNRDRESFYREKQFLRTCCCIRIMKLLIYTDIICKAMSGLHERLNECALIAIFYCIFCLHKVV